MLAQRRPDRRHRLEDEPQGEAPIRSAWGRDDHVGQLGLRDRGPDVARGAQAPAGGVDQLLEPRLGHGRAALVDLPHQLRVDVGAHHAVPLGRDHRRERRAELAETDHGHTHEAHPFRAETSDFTTSGRVSVNGSSPSPQLSAFVTSGPSRYIRRASPRIRRRGIQVIPLDVMRS